MHQQLLKTLAVSLLVTTGCRPTEAPQPTAVPAEPARAEPAFDPASTIWTAERTADPELLHLHVQAAAAPGAFVVPWLEGVTFRPCAVRVEQGDEIVQTAFLSYDEDDRLVGIDVDGRSQTIERDDDGHLLVAHGFEYEWVGGRVERMIESKARIHALEYDDDGRLVGIESTLADESPLRRHVLEYDEQQRLAVRRFTGSTGDHGVTHFVYDERGRLVRIDVEFTDPGGIQQRQPAVRLEYERDRLVEFGPARITYDEGGRVASLIGEATATHYDYVCA